MSGRVGQRRPRWCDARCGLARTVRGMQTVCKILASLHLLGNLSQSFLLQHARALPIVHPESEDPFVFKTRRGFHLLTNVNTYHRRCTSGVPCGGHAFSEDPPRDSDPPGTVLGTPEVFPAVNPYGKYLVAQIMRWPSTATSRLSHRAAPIAAPRR
jgi:hypothetical protein